MAVPEDLLILVSCNSLKVQVSEYGQLPGRVLVEWSHASMLLVFPLNRLEEIALKIDQNKLYSITSTTGPGLLGLTNPTKIFEEYLGEREFSDLEIPCAVVAVDIKTNREIILNKGRVVDAILATIAVPGIFPPQNIYEYELVDGGVLNPVPVSLARKLAPRLPVVAVVLSPQMEKPGRMAHIPLPVKVPTPIMDRITHSRLAQAFSIFMQSIEIGQRMITELRLEVDKPEIIIRPEVDSIGLLDKVDIPSVIQLGYSAAKHVRLSACNLWILDKALT